MKRTQCNFGSLPQHQFRLPVWEILPPSEVRGIASEFRQPGFIQPGEGGAEFQREPPGDRVAFVFRPIEGTRHRPKQDRQGYAKGGAS